MNDTAVIEKPVVKKDWKLIRCIYDYMGMKCDEIQDPERFANHVEEGDDISWCIVTILEHNGRPITRIELEGSKENLEYVLS